MRIITILVDRYEPNMVLRTKLINDAIQKELQPFDEVTNIHVSEEELGTILYVTVKKVMPYNDPNMLRIHTNPYNPLDSNPNIPYDNLNNPLRSGDRLVQQPGSISGGITLDTTHTGTDATARLNLDRPAMSRAQLDEIFRS